MKNLDYKAKLIIHQANDIDFVTAKKLAKWLREKAKIVEKDFMRFAPTFTSKYMIR